ncbi:MAG: TetR/AcrR family transcriptional regulator [Desulfarculaceae bacterium]|nr:TetR/AcrR family transcriptional regulator [Desulfarculaceae bacterium]MCF8070863.1 TetR/AcrR family transcriptional regulator [Desulfarculaceae bacterium]MCF8100451.1 TetR/AcrR family transcriptional regulator [Desulfarculaceae bacterium]MCF8117963.1 TetR/AcrR family transcriptional regulator [Desulfarculaceae bacterium]
MTSGDTPKHNGDQDLERMRDQVAEAAARLYEKKGRSASVDEIAVAAGISTPVTYQFVKKPSDIMLLIMERLQTKFHLGVQEAVVEGAPALDRLLEAMAQFFKVVDSDAAKVVLVYRDSLTLDHEGRKRIMQLERDGVEVFKNILDEGVASGEFRTMDCDLAAYNIVMAGHGWALKSWHYKRRGLSFESYLARQQDLVAAMVRA